AYGSSTVDRPPGPARMETSSVTPDFTHPRRRTHGTWTGAVGYWPPLTHATGPMQLRTIPTLLAAALLATAGHASAQQSGSGDDRFTLRLGAMNAKAETELSASTTFMDEPYSFSQGFDFGSSE